MYFPGRIEAIFEKTQTLHETIVREVPLVFISKPYYENSQYVYMLRQELCELNLQIPHANLASSTGPDALLLLGGLMIHDRSQKRITLSNQTVIYYKHIIFFSNIAVEGEVRAPDLSLATLQALVSALKYHRMRSTLWKVPNTAPRKAVPLPVVPATATVQTPNPGDHPLHAFFLSQFCHMKKAYSIALYEHAKSHWIFELQP